MRITIKKNTFLFSIAAVKFFGLKKGHYLIFSNEIIDGQWVFYQTESALGPKLSPLGCKLSYAGGAGNIRNRMNNNTRQLRVISQILARHFRGQTKLLLEEDTSIPGSKLVKIITT